MSEFLNETLEDSDFDTILSADIDFSGDVEFEKLFMIRGVLTGTIRGKSTLLIDTGAIVEATVDAPHVIIRGTVRGNVHAVEKLLISKTGILVGDIETAEISFEAGCSFNGHCTMLERKIGTLSLNSDEL
ncbi:MAG: polymer-forming cytoskeletal protein [Treponema sp.]|jgi:cytoskeletal protein CcmA (bactofilin family)|nr:polymer-forming cytoskeletal protein [Treponema sp.]